jgi:cyclopropane fatty-acyl-phospholipid synthase-like methyltransferase
MNKPDASLTRIDEERPVPWGDHGIYLWHRARYQFAQRFTQGKRVLDVGCGEGYGPSLLAEDAAEVVGIDYSPEAVRHASQAYARENLRFEVADAADLPGLFREFDVVTCFEVIEHLGAEADLLQKLAKTLRPGGLALVSTPNRLVDDAFRTVSGRTQDAYHVNVMTPSELRDRASRHFEHVVVYGQSVRGSRFHTLIKWLDVFNLRHRLVRSVGAQRALAATAFGHDPLHPTAFRFSRVLVKQSPIVVLVGRA